MKKVISLVLIFITVSSLAFLLSCGSSSNSLEGNYIHKDGVIIRFSKDGSFYYPQEARLYGSYVLFNGYEGTLHYETDQIGEWKTVNFTVSNDKKQIKLSNGEVYQKKSKKSKVLSNDPLKRAG